MREAKIIKKQNNEMSRRILEMKRNGSTNRQIAETFNISKAQVWELIKQEELKHDEYTPILKKMLPVHVRKVLTNEFQEETVYERPEMLASMGADYLLEKRGLGRKKLKIIVSCLQSLGYQVNMETGIDQSHWILPYWETARNILRKYFLYSEENSLDDAAYIPVVRLIIESTVEIIQKGGINAKQREDLKLRLIQFNRQMYENLWIKNAKEDEGDNFNHEDELERARYTFDYIFEYGRHP